MEQAATLRESRWRLHPALLVLVAALLATAVWNALAGAAGVGRLDAPVTPERMLEAFEDGGG